jgi:hypothetical protein
MEIRKILCKIFGHIGNIQWGVNDKDGNPLFKCSFCCRDDLKELIPKENRNDKSVRALYKRQHKV